MLIRHGQSSSNLAWSQRQEISGDEDPALTELGQAQAIALAGAFADGRLPRPDHLMTSLMRRAVQTVAPLAQFLDMPVRGLAGVHEVGGVCRGAWDGDRQPRPGLGRAELLALCPQLTLGDDVTHEGWYHKPVESRAEGWTRASVVAGQLLDEFGGTDDLVAIVCHGLLMNLLIRALIGWQPDMSEPVLDVWFEISNTGTVLVSVPGGSGDRVRVYWLNRTDHLAAGQTTV